MLTVLFHMLEGGGLFFAFLVCGRRFLMRQVLFLAGFVSYADSFSVYASGFVSSELPFGFTFRGLGFWVRLKNMKEQEMKQKTRPELWQTSLGLCLGVF